MKSFFKDLIYPLFILIVAIVVLFYYFKNITSMENNKKWNYPFTKKVDVVDDYFGVKVADPYRWLEDENSPETKEWIKKQNELTFSYLSKIPYRTKIKKRLEELWNYERKSTPFVKGDLTFYFYNEGLQNQSVLYVKKKDENPKVLIDPNKFSKDGTIALANIGISQDAKYIAYSISKGGSDWQEIVVKNIETGEILGDTIKWAKFTAISWANDGFYYSGYEPPRKGKELSARNEFHKLFYHKLGTPQEEDKIVMENKEDPYRMFYASVSEDGKFLFVYEEAKNSMGNRIWVKDLNKNTDFVLLNESFDYEYGVVGNIGTVLYIRTNKDAENYKLLSVDLKNPKKLVWNEVIAETENVLLDVSLANFNNIVVKYMKDANDKLYIYDKTGNFIKEIKLPTLGSVGGPNAYYDKDFMFYSFTSFLYPSVIYKYNFKTDTSEVIFRPQINFDFDKYVTKQVFYKSKDGTKVPMFIVHKKNMKLDGNNPAWLYGYGGFNISLKPFFSPARLVLFENGVVFAVANLRGGGEYGRKWHEAGMKLNKQNVFDDFISAAEYLIKEKYTSSDKLIINGGSNGGLLVGAVTNQRPDLFAVAIPSVGVMDMLRFHKFTIGWNWVTDYGSSEDSVQFEYLYKYSPLHNIKENVEYPAVLVTTADHDDRVVPAHSFKYIATLQEKYNGKNPVMIRIETMAGHGAGKPVSKVIEEIADMYAFAFYNVGLKQCCKENK